MSPSRPRISQQECDDDIRVLCAHTAELKKLLIRMRWHKYLHALPDFIEFTLTHVVLTSLYALVFIESHFPAIAVFFFWLTSYVITLTMYYGIKRWLSRRGNKAHWVRG